jgi:hypothetical protein
MQVKKLFIIQSSPASSPLGTNILNTLFSNILNNPYVFREKTRRQVIMKIMVASIPQI